MAKRSVDPEEPAPNPIPQRVADVLADKDFMRRVRKSAEDSARGVGFTRWADLKHKNAGH